MNLFACAINNSISHNSKPYKLPNHLIRSSWEIKGRIILQFEEEAVSAKLHWLQDDESFIAKVLCAALDFDNSFNW